MRGGRDGGGEAFGGSRIQGLDHILSAGYVERVLLVVPEHLTHHGVVTDIVNKGLVHWDSNLERAGEGREGRGKGVTTFSNK